MKDVFSWLENVKQNLNGSGPSVDEEELNSFKKRLNAVTTFEEFSNIQKEVIEKKLTFITSIDKKVCVSDKFGVLINNNDECKTSIDFAMKQKSPDKVIRYMIYDQKALRIRGRRSNLDFLHKSIRVAKMEWNDYKVFAQTLHDQLETKLKEIETRPADNRYKASLLERTTELLNRAKALLA